MYLLPSRISGISIRRFRIFDPSSQSLRRLFLAESEYGRFWPPHKTFFLPSFESLQTSVLLAFPAHAFGTSFTGNIATCLISVLDTIVWSFWRFLFLESFQCQPLRDPYLGLQSLPAIIGEWERCATHHLALGLQTRLHLTLLSMVYTLSLKACV